MSVVLCLALLLPNAVVHAAATLAPVEPGTRQINDWIQQGRAAVLVRDYEQAIASFSKALALVGQGSDEYRRALEWLGLSYARSGRAERAEAIYQDYLARFPTGEDAERVRQRLQSLQTARSQARKKLKFSQRRSDPFEFYGSFSQFSIRDVSRLDNGDYVSSSALLSDLDLAGRYRSDRFDVKSRLATSHRHRFIKSRAAKDRLRLSSLYLSVRDRQQGLYLSLGRQSGSSSGVLGRYDGAQLSYDIDSQWTLNLVSGRPVELSGSSNTKRYFYGLSVDAGPFADHWGLNAFMIRQVADQMTDRAALGGELRYNSETDSYLGLVDFDTVFSRLNSALLVANWYLPASTTLNVVADYRTAPLLSAENALIGQAETSIAALLTRLSEGELRSVARDRTSALSTLTLSASRPLSKKVQMSADITVSRQSETPASAGVPAVASTGNETFYALQFMGNGLIKSHDVSIVSLRYADTAFSNTSSLDMNMRYPLTPRWRADPRLGMDYRRNRDHTRALTLRPTFRIDYLWKRDVSYDIELGAVWSDDLGSGAGNTLDFSFELGYRVDF